VAKILSSMKSIDDNILDTPVQKDKKWNLGADEILEVEGVVCRKEGKKESRIKTRKTRKSKCPSLAR
jgi:hypothetical protein